MSFFFLLRQDLIQTTYDAMFSAIKVCRAGQRFCEIGKAISKVANGNGFKGVVREYCGHGIGKLFHCAPEILHYWPNRAPGVMKAGNCFTIEPMINAGTRKNCEWPDGWTVVTAGIQCGSHLGRLSPNHHYHHCLFGLL